MNIWVTTKITSPITWRKRTGLKSISDSPLELDCSLNNLGEIELIEHIILEHEDIKVTNTEENPDNVKPYNQGKTMVKSNRVMAELPALFWNVVRL